MVELVIVVTKVRVRFFALVSAAGQSWRPSGRGNTVSAVPRETLDSQTKKLLDYDSIHQWSSVVSRCIPISTLCSIMEWVWVGCCWQTSQVKSGRPCHCSCFVHSLVSARAVALASLACLRHPEGRGDSKHTTAHPCPLFTLLLVFLLVQ